MASKTHLNKLIQLSNNEEAALANLNANVDILNDVIDDYVSRSGLVPTQLQEPLDLGNQRIINVGTPESDNDVVRYKDVKDALDELHSIEADLQDVENAVTRANNAASSADQSAGIAVAAKVDAVDAKDDAVNAKNAAVQAKDDITTLLTVDYPEITTVANNISDVQTVAGVASDVSTVASIASDVADVADIVSDVSTVANVDSDISTVAGIASDVSTVAGVSTAVQAVEDNLTAVQNAAQNASDAADSAELAHKWATSSTVVESGQYGASYYALRAANYMNGAESARDLARNWANKTDGAVADNEYSAKYYAEQAAAIVAVLGTVMVYKGSVASYANLPATGNTTGDVWNVLDTGKNYAWTGSAWDDFGGAITVSIAACSDVSLTTPATGDVLVYNSVSGKWENGTVDSLPSQTGQSGKFLKTDGTNASWANAPTELPSQSGHLGQFLKTNGTNVSWSSIPPELPNTSGQSGKFLTNDGTDVSWADVPSGGASSLTDIAQAGTGITFTEVPVVGYSIIGSPTITDGVLSSITASNYLQLTNSFNPQNATWEFFFKITTGNNVSTEQEIFSARHQDNNISDDRYGIGIAVKNNKFELFCSTNGTSWGIDEFGTYTVLTNTTYWLKVGWNGTKYYLAYSLDGETYTEVISSNSSSPLCSIAVSYIGVYHHGENFSNNFLGSIDLKNTYYTITGSEAWRAYVDDGKTEISTSALLNNGTGGNLAILGTTSSPDGFDNYNIAIGYGSSCNMGEGVAIGHNAKYMSNSTGAGGVAIGTNCEAGIGSVAIGRYAKAKEDNGRYGIALGYGSQVTTYGGIQLGGQNFTNSDDHSMYVGLYNGNSWYNHKLLNKDGTIPVARYITFTGTDGVNVGVAGTVPAPTTSDAGKFLCADGTWAAAGGGSASYDALTETITL